MWEGIILVICKLFTVCQTNMSRKLCDHMTMSWGEKKNASKSKPALHYLTKIIISIITFSNKMSKGIHTKVSEVIHYWMTKVVRHKAYTASQICNLFFFLAIFYFEKIYKNIVNSDKRSKC